MGLLGVAKYHWERMAVRERREFLAKLQESMGKSALTEDDVPLEALSYVGDFDSLPGEFQGILTLSLANGDFSPDIDSCGGDSKEKLRLLLYGKGFSVEAYKASIQRMSGIASALRGQQDQY